MRADPKPLKRIMAATLVVLATTGAAACSSGGGDSTATTSAPTTTAVADVTTTVAGVSGADITEADLASTLLTVDDLPAGFTEQAGSDDDSSSLCNDLQPDVEVPALQKAKTQFVLDPNAGPLIGTGAGSYTDDAEASSFLAAISADVAQCPDPYPITGSDGSTLTYAVAPLDFTAAGDESTAFQFTITGGPAPLTIDVVDVRLGPVVFQVGEVSSTSIDTSELEDLVAVQLDRTQAALLD